MENEIFISDLKKIFYALELIFNKKDCKQIFNRLVRQLKKAKKK